MPSKYIPYHLRKGSIYKITNLVDGKAYIGQSTLIRKRINEHMNWRNPKSYIDKSIRKYGKEKFHKGFIWRYV